MREFAKAVARAIATLAILPRLALFHLAAAIVGRERAFESACQRLSMVPGLRGQYLRRAFLARTLAGGCAASSAIEFGVLFSKMDSSIEENVYIGPRCHLGSVYLERDVMLAAGVHIPSGPHTHGTDASVPMREQAGRLQRIRIGAGTWIGSNAVVLANVGRDTIVGAGAVVTQPIPDGVIAGGVPARVIRRRDETQSRLA
jgi:acetyltransferase-like isoleucine patch superfamily enzyme